MTISVEAIQKASGTLKVIGHPVRLRIIELLEKGTLSVKDIQAELQLEQPVISQHLSLMKSNGIVTGKRDGHQVRYSLENDQVKKILKCIQECPLN